MIGLVLVSHSAALAEGVRELAAQMTQGRVPIAVAGGIDDPDNPIGTDALKVLAAVESVYSPDGVIILMDLGSALMSAETALELLDEGKRPHVFLSDAPFVEGAIAAAVQASIGSPIEDVLAEARGALAAKQRHLDAEAPMNAEGLHLRLIVPNRLGLHARPAARLVSLVGQYKALVTLCKGEQSANARSVNAVTLLDVRQGDVLDVFAEGDDAPIVLEAIRRLAEDNFGDQDQAEAAPPRISQPHSPDVLVGVSASPGLAVGQVCRLEDVPPKLPLTVVDDAEQEIARLEAAISRAQAALGSLIEHGTDIFQAHQLMLRDDGLLNDARARIPRSNAETGWWEAVEAMAGRYRQSENEYLQARAADVYDVGWQVLRQLSPDIAAVPELPEACILAASDLSPSQTAQLDPRRVLGIVLGQGGATSHMAIIARGLGIPTVVGLRASLDDLREGQTVIVDGDQGWLYARPTEAQLAEFRQKIDERERQREDGRLPAITLDGRRVEVAANIGSPADAARLLEMGAEGVGLFRTELLFMNRAHAPDEEEQYQAYAATGAALNGLPLTIRTLDVGGDKHIPYLDLPREENPFLGYRGIRYWLDQPELAEQQLRAICRASADHPIRVMFPMVSTLDELERARQLLQRVQVQLTTAAIPFNPEMQVGIMIEVPAAALMAAQFAEQVDFFSIGTNDLTQYLMAADRGSARVSALATGFQPAVLRLIRQVIDAAHARGKWVGICGEMAGDPRLTRLLVGLGVDELSLSAPAIPEIKRIIRQTSYAEAQANATHLLTLATSAQVEAYLREQLA
jgi:phosphoenolpyruvate-protein phosphotransferase/dihydroxyacetone kinase phosphotransfer subunit